MNAKDLAAQAARVTARPKKVAGESETKPDGVASGRGNAPRAKPVRMTTDLAPMVHQALNEFAARVASRTGRVRVASSDVIRALLAELEKNPDLQAKIQTRIEAMEQ